VGKNDVTFTDEELQLVAIKALSMITGQRCAMQLLYLCTLHAGYGALFWQ
jgi:hypothetical protein